MLNFKMTKHASADRLERIAQINMTVGFGEILKWDWQDQKSEYYCLTSTGVFAVVAPDKQTLITAWIASFAQGVKFYDSVSEMPPFMRAKLRKNEKYRTLMGEQKMYMIEFLLRNERHIQHFDTRAEMQERIKFLEWWYNDDFRLISED